MPAQRRLAIATAGFRGGGAASVGEPLLVAVEDPVAVQVDEDLVAVDAEGTVDIDAGPYTVLVPDVIQVAVQDEENTQI